MIFGGVTTERLQLNHIELWSGRTADHHSPTARTALPKVRQLLFEDSELRELEVRRAGLAEAFVEITREAA